MTSPIKLKIALKDLPHKCERTLLVPEDINMRQLHFIIQDSFGWLNAHLFEFTNAKVKQTIRVGMPDDFEMDSWSDIELNIAHEVKLKETFLEEYQGKAFWYNYDFGDDWWHQISFLKLTQKDKEAYDGSPICIKAEGKCPPEDVGGSYGYREFLEIIKNKKHPEHKETRIWYGFEKGEKFDEIQVDLQRINLYLDDLYDTEHWEDTSYEFF